MANFSFTNLGSGILDATKGAINNYVNQPTAPKTTSPAVTIPPATNNYTTSNSTPTTTYKAPTTGTQTGFLNTTSPLVNQINTATATTATAAPKQATPTSSTATQTPTTYTYGQNVTDASGKVIGQAMYDPNTGKPLANPNAQVQQPTQPIYNPGTPQPTQQYTAPQYTPANTNYQTLVTDAANRSTKAGEDYKAAQEEAKRISDQQTALAGDYAQKTQNIAGTAGFLTQQTGLQGQLANKYNTVQGALANQYNAATNRLGAANTQQGLQQGMLTSAMGATAPVNQFGQLTNPFTANPISGGDYTQNPQLQSAVQQAVQIAMKSGPSNPSVQALLSTFGMPGQQAFTQAMQEATGGNFNPIALDTAGSDNVKIAQAFANTGTTINAAKQNIQGLSEQATNLIEQAGLNTKDANWANAKINTYVNAQSNPVAYRTLQALNNEAQKFFSTIAGSGSNLIPTQVTENIQNLDITDMSSLKLQEFLQNIQAIGSAQANTALSQSQGAYGTGAGSFYTGGNQGTNTQLNPGSTNYSSALSQGLVTGGAVLGGTAGAIKTGAVDYLSKVFNIFK